DDPQRVGDTGRLTPAPRRERPGREASGRARGRRRHPGGSPPGPLLVPRYPPLPRGVRRPRPKKPAAAGRGRGPRGRGRRPRDRPRPPGLRADGLLPGRGRGFRGPPRGPQVGSAGRGGGAGRPVPHARRSLHRPRRPPPRRPRRPVPKAQDLRALRDPFAGQARRALRAAGPKRGGGHRAGPSGGASRGRPVAGLRRGDCRGTRPKRGGGLGGRACHRGSQATPGGRGNGSGGDGPEPRGGGERGAGPRRQGRQDAGAHRGRRDGEVLAGCGVGGRNRVERGGAGALGVGGARLAPQPREGEEDLLRRRHGVRGPAGPFLGRRRGGGAGGRRPEAGPAVPGRRAADLGFGRGRGRLPRLAGPDAAHRGGPAGRGGREPRPARAARRPRPPVPLPAGLHALRPSRLRGRPTHPGAPGADLRPGRGPRLPEPV
ncbi:MAG: hypothetical protein AVDCRST_MAG55-2687, partial [uncultured Rubrobacteraceae bacterium]